MTDNEIIEALECCANNPNDSVCYESKCPLFGQKCIDVLGKNALDLITRKKAEIERLTEENKKVSAYIGNGWGYVSFLEFVKNQRAEAIKEFAERLKDKVRLYKASEWQGFKYIPLGEIDNLVKEMVGDVG